MSKTQDINNIDGSLKYKKSMSDYDDQLIMNNKQNYILSIYMMLSNVTLTIVILYIMLQYQDLLLSGMVIFGLCCCGFSERIMLSAIQQHDVTLLAVFKLREEYNKEKDEEFKHRERNKEEYKKILQNGSSIELFKKEIHEAALNVARRKEEEQKL